MSTQHTDLSTVLADLGPILLVEAEAVGLTPLEFYLHERTVRRHMREAMLRLTGRNFVYVPAFRTAQQILDFTIDRMGVSRNLSSAFLHDWDFLGLDGGEFYEIMELPVSHQGMSSVDARARFAEVGFDGSIAAFLVWLEQERPVGHVRATIPPHEQLRNVSGQMHTIVAGTSLGKPVLDLHPVDANWFAQHRLVGFKKVLPALRAA